MAFFFSFLVYQETQRDLVGHFSNQDFILNIMHASWFKTNPHTAERKII